MPHRVLTVLAVATCLLSPAWAAETQPAAKSPAADADPIKQAKSDKKDVPTKVADKKPADKKNKTDKTDVDKKPDPMSADTWSGLELRNIGPAITEGRIVDLAVDRDNSNRFFVAAASGGVWRTLNAGVTFEPIFDGEASYSIGCITIDPNNSNVIWVGSGENNSQRSVAYGDGVYRSEDGGKSWTNMGLKESEHIGRIVVDPRDSNVVYVAAQGPLWKSGGERGVYKTIDGGKTWKAVLTVDAETGANEVLMDPRNPQILYASTYQRRRHVWTLIDGGPGSAIYRSNDAGANWTKLENGLPKEDKGKIGLALAPSAPDTVYAIVESTPKNGGFYRSTDRGANWSKMSGEGSSSPQYYNKIYVDPVNKDRVYSTDTFLRVSNDGGKTFARLGEKSKHVDNHVIWVDPRDNDHYRVGCDGGLYESFDRGTTWRFDANLPIIQFYRVAVSNDGPFYNVYGGTQDNFSLGGPSRSRRQNGIPNSEWYVTQGGDGFWSAVDPEDPNIAYAEAQHGALVRFDKKSGETLYIQPQEGKGEPGLRWNWDSPLLISPHSHTRLYFAANKLFRSDDRGASWKAISSDLTRQVDRNQLKVMGKVWSIDTVAKNASTSFYGNIVSLSESPKQENLVYVGTDDGLVQVTEDAGGSWRKIDTFPGVPEMTYVSSLKASQHDAGTVYASFDNHKMGDFKPYVLKSADRGKTWTSIAGDLPGRGSVYSLAEDHVDPSLLFAGTEFGLFFTTDGGKKWIQLKGGMPTIAVKDLVVQKNENDLVLASFGRGFFVLDDYSPLRQAKAETLAANAVLFPVKTALAYMPALPIGGRDKGFLGESYYLAPNPAFGATFTYYLKDSLKTRKKLRQETEKKLVKEGKDLPYPSWDALRAESSEEDPTILMVVTDGQGNVVRKLTGPATSGVHRVAWDLRYPAVVAASDDGGAGDDSGDDGPTGPIAVPGGYNVSLFERLDGKETALSEPQAFKVEAVSTASLPAADQATLLAFEQKVGRLQRAVAGAEETVDATKTELAAIKKALLATPKPTTELMDRALALEAKLRQLSIKLSGDSLVASRNEPTPPGISGRVGAIVGTQWNSTSAPTGTSLDAYRIAGEEFTGVLADLHQLVDQDLRDLRARIETAGAPWTPGRVPVWSME
ncbi:MAG: glycosyl hydrolase [Acidobacteriota bacterium]